MRLICLMPVRNEAWCLGLTARAVLMWCDELVILDHASADPTPAIIWELANEYGGRITSMFEEDPQWNEMAHRQRLLCAAREQGATHIVMVDSDEILTGNLLPQINEYVKRAPQGTILQIPWLAMRGSIHRYHASGVWAEQDVSMAFRDDQRYHWAAREGYDFHHRHPMGLPFAASKPIRRNQGGLMHLQFVSDRRLRAKQYLYQLTERLRWPTREPVEVVRNRYSIAVYGHDNAPLSRAYRAQAEPEIIATAPAEWWSPYARWMEHLHIDDEPWQLEECRKIILAHPGIEAGLDNFGIV